MVPIAPKERFKHLPFRIGDGPSETGARLGGRAPSLDYPAKLRDDAEYVLTVPIAAQPVVYASVFVNCDFDALLDAMNAGIQADDRVVVVAHPEAGRSDSTRYQSGLSAHPLLIGDSVCDDVDTIDDQKIFAGGHKIGGSPHCIQEPELEGAGDLMNRGFVHVLQLDFPGREDGDVRGNWPFADGLFNLFMRLDRDEPPRWAFQK
jgi:hypothetical protein